VGEEILRAKGAGPPVGMTGQDKGEPKTNRKQEKPKTNPHPYKPRVQHPENRPEGQAKKEGERLKFGCGLVPECV
jgi:hypothetical protein